MLQCGTSLCGPCRVIRHEGGKFEVEEVLNLWRNFEEQTLKDIWRNFEVPSKKLWSFRETLMFPSKKLQRISKFLQNSIL